MCVYTFCFKIAKYTIRRHNKTHVTGVRDTQENPLSTFSEISISGYKRTINAVDRTLKTVLTVWLDAHPEHFYQPPSHGDLHDLIRFAKLNMPDSDLCQRAKVKLESFVRDGIAGIVPSSTAVLSM